MKILLSVMISLLFVSGMFAQTSSEEKEVRQAIQLYFDGFNSHDVGRVAEFTTADWNHINPSGGRRRGRDDVLKELKEVHATFLKGVHMTIEDMDVRFATPDVAVVTATNEISSYTLPNGVKHENERQIKTFVVVKQRGRWLIMQDQNTIIGR